MTLQDFIKEKGLKREISPTSSRLNREPGDYFVTDSKMGTRVDWAESDVIANAIYLGC